MGGYGNTIFYITFFNMSSCISLQNKAGFFVFFQFSTFCENITNLLFKGSTFELISIIKIRDQGVEFVFFVLRFEICISGVAFKLKVCFLCFWEMGVFVKSL